jgi:hypothetical protein
VALFKKDVSNFPQTVASAGPITDALTEGQIPAFLATQTPQQIAWILAGNSGQPGIYAIRQFQDAPGGEIKGYELSYQQDFTFLPGFLKNFGIQANYTHRSRSCSNIDPLHHGAVRPQVTMGGVVTGARNRRISRQKYETPKWSARRAYRDAYVSQYPIAAGTCDPGAYDSPLMNDSSAAGPRATSTRGYLAGDRPPVTTQASTFPTRPRPLEKVESRFRRSIGTARSLRASG